MIVMYNVMVQNVGEPQLIESFEDRNAAQECMIEYQEKSKLSFYYIEEDFK